MTLLRPKQISPESGDDGDVLTLGGGVPSWAPPAGGGGGGSGGAPAGVVWEQQVDNALTSTTGLTTAASTWSIVSGQLQVDTNSNAWRSARIDTLLPPALAYCFEIEVEYQSTHGSGDYISIGLYDSAATAVGSTQGFEMRLGGRNGVEFFSAGSVQYSDSSAPTTIADGWRKLKVLCSGGMVVGLIDGVPQFQVAGQVGIDSELGLKAIFGAFGTFVARFRNAKVWTVPWLDTSIVEGTPAAAIVTTKSTKRVGGGNYTFAGSSTTFGAIDATNLDYLTLDLAIGDQVDLMLSFQAYLASGTNAYAFDFEVDRPTSANERANASCDVGVGYQAFDGNRKTHTVWTTYTATEAGVHGFRPVWRGSGAGSMTMANATSGADDSPITFRVTNLGPAS